MKIENEELTPRPNPSNPTKEYNGGGEVICVAICRTNEVIFDESLGRRESERQSIDIPLSPLSSTAAM